MPSITSIATVEPIPMNLRRDGLPFLLIVLGLGYPIARQLLPGVVRPALLLPLVLLLIWFVWRLRQPPSLIQSPLGVPILLVAISLVLSSIRGVADPATIVAELFHWGAVGVILLLTIETLAAGWRHILYTRAILLIVGLALLHAMATIGFWWWEWWRIWQPGQALIPAGFRRELIGTQPNQAAIIINLGLPFAIAALWQATHLLSRLVWGAWLFLATVALFFTASRGGWLTSSVIILLMLAPLLWHAAHAQQWRRVGTTLLLTGVYVSLFGLLLTQSFGEIVAHRTNPLQPSQARVRVSPTPTPSPTDSNHNGNARREEALRSLSNPMGRTIFWTRALEFFAERPILGVGPKGFSFRYAVEEPYSRIFRAPHPHNIALTVLSESGLVGVLAWIALLGMVALVWWHGWRDHAGHDHTCMSEKRLLLLSCGAMGVGLLVHGIVEVPAIALSGIGMAMVAVGLSVAHCWKRVSWSSTWIRPVHIHSVLIIVAFLAWATGILMVMQRTTWQTLLNETAAAIQVGDLTQARAHAEAAIERYPFGGEGYTARATVLAWMAIRDPSIGVDARAAQSLAVVRDPTNPAGPLNHAALLIQQGETAQAEAALAEHYDHDRSKWAVTAVMLARLREGAGDDAAAAAYWEHALAREPTIANSIACQQSVICSNLEPQSAYATALAEAQQLAAHANANALQQLWELADSWDSVDIWAMGALAAADAGDTTMHERFLAAATAQANTIGKEPTRLLAVALLRAAMADNDQDAIRALLTEWLVGADIRLVPQVGHMLLTPTDHLFAVVAYEAAQQLGDEMWIGRARAYRDYVVGALGGS